MLEESLQSSQIGVCVKDPHKRVLTQNTPCRRACGDRRGQVCVEGCMELYAKDESHQWKDWGARVYKNSNMFGGFFDVTLLCSTENIVTFLQPPKEKYEMALAYYREKGLTKRETQVVSLAIRGNSNSDICRLLSISKATLRTHLNNVYRKFRDLGEIPEFIPTCRLTD